MKTKKNQKRKK